MFKALEDVVHGSHCKILRGLLHGVHLGPFFTEHYYEKGVFHFKGSLAREVGACRRGQKQAAGRVSPQEPDRNRREVNVAARACRVCARCEYGCQC